jgi:redox-sensitive bicupin YhaK (pirin superfamily)
VLGSANSVKHQLQPGRKSWVQVVRGSVDVNGKAAGGGDGVALEDEPGLTITAREDNSEILVFDLP